MRGRALRRWYEREAIAYRSARHVFAFSGATRDSLVEDYDVDPERVTVVGAGANGGLPPVTGATSLPDRPNVLFIGNDFARKGGWDLLAAFAECAPVGTGGDVAPRRNTAGRAVHPGCRGTGSGSRPLAHRPVVRRGVRLRASFGLRPVPPGAAGGHGPRSSRGHHELVRHSGHGPRRGGRAGRSRLGPVEPGLCDRAIHDRPPPQRLDGCCRANPGSRGVHVGARRRPDGTSADELVSLAAPSEGTRCDARLLALVGASLVVLAYRPRRVRGPGRAGLRRRWRTLPLRGFQPLRRCRQRPLLLSSAVAHTS